MKDGGHLASVHSINVWIDQRKTFFIDLFIQGLPELSPESAPSLEQKEPILINLNNCYLKNVKLLVSSHTLACLGRVR